MPCRVACRSPQEHRKRQQWLANLFLTGEFAGNRFPWRAKSIYNGGRLWSGVFQMDQWQATKGQSPGICFGRSMRLDIYGCVCITLKQFFLEVRVHVATDGAWYGAIDSSILTRSGRFF